EHGELDRLGKADRLLDAGLRGSSGFDRSTGDRDQYQRPFADAIAGGRPDDVFDISRNRVLLRFLAPALLRRLEELEWRAGHNGRDSVLIDELRVPVATQQHAEIVEPGDDSLQLYAVDEKNRERSLVLADIVEKGVLKVLGAISHVFSLSAFRVE